MGLIISCCCDDDIEDDSDYYEHRATRSNSVRRSTRSGTVQTSTRRISTSTSRGFRPNRSAWPNNNNNNNKRNESSSSTYRVQTANTFTSSSSSPDLEVTHFIDTLLQIRIEDLKLSSNDRQSDRIIQPRVEEIFGSELLRSLTEEDLPLEFDDSVQYRRIFTALTLFEVWTEISRNFHGNTTDPEMEFDEKLCKRSVKKTNRKNVMTVSLTALRDHNLCQNLPWIRNWIVLLTTVDKRALCLGYVTKQSPFGSDHVSLSGECDIELEIEIHINEWFSLNEFDPIFMLYIKPLFKLEPELKKLRSMKQLACTRPEVMKHVLKPSRTVCLGNPSQISSWVFVDREALNATQTVAIQSSLEAIRYRQDNMLKMIMIQGPPGTGKTFTLMEIVKNLVFNHRNSGEPLRVLICTTTNGAVDEVGRRLCQVKSRWSRQLRRDFWFVRIGMRSNIHEDLLEYYLDEVVKKPSKVSNTGKQRTSHQGYLKKQCLLDADVILSTLGSCQGFAMDVFRKSQNAIRCLIVDEAGQCTEPELIMSLVYPSITKIILIGDHKQLPATIISPTASQLGLGRSLFERFYSYFDREEITSPMVTMMEQFRMHSDICHFPSRRFYLDQLSTVPGSGENSLIPLKPYRVFDVEDSREILDRKMMSRSNPKEAELVVKLIQAIYSLLSISNKDMKKTVTIGVITFYQGQRQLIESLLEKCQNGVYSKQVEVKTVDSYQGQERDIIILSCVRAFEPEDLREPNSIGFVRSEQRMNVALTRAKSALLVCMRAPTLVRATAWSQLIRDAKNRNCFMPINSEISIEKLCRKIA